MKFSLENLCSQFIEARDVIRDTFKWDSSYLPPVCANLFCAAGAVPDADRLRACRDLINQKTGIFSSFRGHIRVPLACLLSMEDRPEEKFDRAKEVYQLLRERFSASDYLALASFLLAEYGCTEDQIARGKRIYRLMKGEHPFLTSSEDSIFALMLAWSLPAPFIIPLYADLGQDSEYISTSLSAQTVASILLFIGVAAYSLA